MSIFFFFLLRKLEMASTSEDVILALKETLRYGLFLGAFAGTFVSVDEIIAALGGHRRHDLYPSLVFSFPFLCLLYFFFFFIL